MARPYRFIRKVIALGGQCLSSTEGISDLLKAVTVTEYVWKLGGGFHKVTLLKW